MKFAIGQAWSLRDIDAPNARIVIGRIEPAAQLDGQIVIHCTIFDAVIADTGDGPEPLIFGHIPFTEDAFSASVDPPSGVCMGAARLPDAQNVRRSKTCPHSVVRISHISGD